MPAEDSRERLEDIFIALLGSPLRPPRLDLPAADGAEAFEVFRLDPGEAVLGQLPPSHGAEELASDVDVAQGFSSMRYRFSHQISSLRPRFRDVGRKQAPAEPRSPPGTGPLTRSGRYPAQARHSRPSSPTHHPGPSP
jgi:hypothetical protein